MKSENKTNKLENKLKSEKKRGKTNGKSKENQNEQSSVGFVRAIATWPRKAGTIHSSITSDYPHHQIAMKYVIASINDDDDEFLFTLKKRSTIQ